MPTTIQYDLVLPGLSDVADITVISNDIQKIADELDLRPRMVDGVIPFEILFSHKDAALTILNEADVYSQLINSGTQYINFIDTNGENTALIKKERTSGNNGDNTLSILLRGLNGNYYGMTIHDNGLAQRITGVTPSVSGLDDETIPTMNYLNSSKATKLVHIDLAETITGDKTFSKHIVINGGHDQSYIRFDNSRLAQANVRNGETWLSLKDGTNDVVNAWVERTATNDPNLYIGMMGDGWTGYDNKRFRIHPHGIEVPNLITGADSKTVVNKAYVESTDGVTNNLVHRTGNENLAHQSNARYYVTTSSGSNRWREIYRWSGRFIGVVRVLSMRIQINDVVVYGRDERLLKWGAEHYTESELNPRIYQNEDGSYSLWMKIRVSDNTLAQIMGDYIGDVEVGTNSKLTLDGIPGTLIRELVE